MKGVDPASLVRQGPSNRYRALLHREDARFGSFLIFCLTIVIDLLYSIAHSFLGLKSLPGGFSDEDI